MPRIIRLVLAALLATGLLVVPGSASEPDPCIDPETEELILITTQTYIHQAEMKAGNLAAFDLSEFPSWNETAPTQSVRQGAGGGYLGNFAFGYAGQDDATFGATFTGKFSGCLDTMLVELYAFLPTNRTGTTGSLNESPFVGWLSLHVDGEPLVLATELETKTIPNARGSATYRIRYAFSGLYEAMKLNGMDPAAEHTIRINATPRYANTSNAVFVYDTTEVPAGILFNGTIDETYATIEV